MVGAQPNIEYYATEATPELMDKFYKELGAISSEIISSDRSASRTNQWQWAAAFERAAATADQIVDHHHFDAGSQATKRMSSSGSEATATATAST